MCQSTNDISNLQGTQGYQDLQTPAGQQSQTQMEAYLRNNQQTQAGNAMEAMGKGIQGIGQSFQPVNGDGIIQIQSNYSNPLQRLQSLNFGS